MVYRVGCGKAGVVAKEMRSFALKELRGICLLDVCYLEDFLIDAGSADENCDRSRQLRGTIDGLFTTTMGLQSASSIIW